MNVKDKFSEIKKLQMEAKEAAKMNDVGVLYERNWLEMHIGSRNVTLNQAASYLWDGTAYMRL